MNFQPKELMTSPKPRLCPSCIATLEANSRFCGHCGLKQPPTIEERQKEHAHKKQRWLNVRWVIIFYIIMLSVSIVSVFGTAIIFSTSHSTIIIVASIVSAALTMGALFISKYDVPVASKNILSYSLFGLIILIPIFLLNHYYHEFLINAMQIKRGSYSDIFFQEGYGYTTVIIIVSIMPGIFEEISFRGLIQEHLRATIGTKQALLITSFIFAIIHLQFLSLPILFLIGLALGYLQIKSGSIIPGMIMHAAHNLLVLLSEWGYGL